MRFSLIAWFLLFACTKPLPAKTTPEGRTKPVQELTAVKIEHSCLISYKDMTNIEWKQLIGSGVIINDRHVLTALHVVDCPIFSIIRIGLADGRFFFMNKKQIDKNQDVALLEVEGDKGFELQWEPAVISTPPPLGSSLCFFSGQPTRSWHCGPLHRRAPTREVSDAIELAALVERGNSGSGIYDTSGQLVGIVTHLGLCPDQATVCKTYAAVISGVIGDVIGKDLNKNEIYHAKHQ